MKRLLGLILALMLTGTALSETVLFGSCPQTGDDPEPIEWLVLEEQDDRTLLLSRYALASLPWHDDREAVTWDASDIRAVLNGVFLEAAFTDAEREAILAVELDNGDDMGYGTPVGANTTDKVFLLSASEGLRYLPETADRAVSPTDYARKQGAYTNGEGNCAWWLRSPGMTPTSPAYFASAGDVGNRAHEVDETIIGVRPAIWVKKGCESAMALLKRIRALEEDARNAMVDQPLTATGIVTYIGKDIHGLPSFRLSDSVDGDCYVHACVKSEEEYTGIQVGDTITVTGNFHILSDDWGLVLKQSAVNQ